MLPPWLQHSLCHVQVAMLWSSCTSMKFAHSCNVCAQCVLHYSLLLAICMWWLQNLVFPTGLLSSSRARSSSSIWLLMHSSAPTGCDVVEFPVSVACSCTLVQKCSRGYYKLSFPQCGILAPGRLDGPPSVTQWVAP